LIYPCKGIERKPNQAVEDGSANPLRSFAAHLTAALGRMKLILSHHLPKLPRLANAANSDLLQTSLSRK
jgi:hypothetical protein